MKRIMSAAIAALGMVLMLVACNKEIVGAGVDGAEAAVLPQIAVEDMGFSVISESEMTGEELYAATLGAVEANCGAELNDELGMEVFSKVKSTFEKANAACADEVMVDGDMDTKALAPLLYKVVKVNYQTLDQSNNEVTASALIVYPLLRKITNVMLINHGTHIGFAMIPTKYTSVEAIMAATGALSILPDYIGLGASADHPDLYLNEEVHGRTSVDALLTLLDYAKAKKLNLASDYKTYIAGYSQGGAVSLASLRRVQQLDQATQKRINLQKVFCGDGQYDLRLTFENYLSDFENGKDLALGSVVPTVINSMFNSYPEEMADINYEDFFTEWALSTGVPQAIHNNDENVIDMMLKFNGKNLDEILNMQYLEDEPEHLNRLLTMMDRQNLCHGWAPQYSLKLLHCNPDGVVPFANFEEAYEGLNNEYMEDPEVVDIKLLSNPLLIHIYGMLVMVDEVLDGSFMK